MKELVQAQKDAETKALEDKGQYESIVNQMKDSHSTETKSLKDQILDLKSQLTGANGVIEDMTVGRKFSESKFVTDSSILPPSISRKEFGSHFDVEDGSVVAYDKPRGSKNRAPLVDGSGSNLNFEEAIERIYSNHPDHKSLIRSKAKPGSGSSTDQSSSTPSSSTPDKSATGISRIRAGLEASD